MTGRTKIHLDTDLGSDPEDVCALAYLLSRDDVEITGITTGHEDAGRRAGYVLECLRLAERSGIPVAAGADDGILGVNRRARFPAEETFWPRPVVALPAGAGAALDLIDASVDQGATVVAIGPLTNLAVYEAMRPGKLAQAGVVLMGGCLMPIADGLPFWGPEMDWNINIDPAAARRVLERCDPLVVMRNVTLQVHLRAADLPRLRSAGGPLAALIARQAEARQLVRDLRPIARENAGLPADLLNFLPDSLTCATALGWDGVKTARVPVQITDERVEGPRWSASPSARGLVLRRGTAGEPDYVPLRTVTDVDGESFHAHWLDLVAPVGARQVLVSSGGGVKGVAQ